MNYWLVKSEPETYSWGDLVKDGKITWDGVRNYQARNFLGQMKEGDLVLFYHSVSDKAVVGLAKVSREAFPDPTTEDPRWLAVELIPFRDFKDKVTLAQIKADPRLQQISLIKQSRLSVMPLKPDEFDVILALGN
jgi:predicted RNA-binding protein with PUA-like domain